MNKENDLQHYLSISPNKFGLYLFDTKSLKNLYKEEITFNLDRDFLNYDLLKKFLDDNVFNIEKLSGKFVENIILSIKVSEDANLIALSTKEVPLIFNLFLFFSLFESFLAKITANVIMFKFL